MKLEVAVLGSPSLIVVMVCQFGRKATLNLNSQSLFSLLGVYTEADVGISFWTEIDWAAEM